MKVRYRHFPHPVLAPFSDDFNKGFFNSDIDVEISKNNYNIVADLNLSNYDLESFIGKEEAKFGIHLECSFTQFRMLKKSTNEKINFSVPAELLDGEVEVSSFIFADKNIDNYNCDSFNSLFKQYNFSVNKGDVLAFGGQFNFTAEKDFDSLKNIPSIFEVQSNDNENPPALDVSLNSEKIMIFLPPESFEQYKRIKENQYLQSSYAAILAVPILTQIIEDIKEGGPDLISQYKSWRWFRVLLNKLKEKNIDLENGEEISDNSVALAQEIIGRPAEKAFKDLEQLNIEEVL